PGPRLNIAEHRVAGHAQPGGIGQLAPYAKGDTDTPADGHRRIGGQRAGEQLPATVDMALNVAEDSAETRVHTIPQADAAVAHRDMANTRQAVGQGRAVGHIRSLSRLVQTIN